VLTPYESTCNQPLR